MSQIHRTAVAAAALCALAALVAAPQIASARTLHYDFVVVDDPGPKDILVGAFGGSNWPEGTVFPIEARELGGSALELTIKDFFLPDVRGRFPNERIEFEILDDALEPTTEIRIGAEVGPNGNWAVNPDMAEPMVKVRMIAGSFSHIVDLPLTTAVVEGEGCFTGVGGEDMSAATGDMNLVGAACVQDSFLPEFDTPFYVNIAGVMEAPEPSAASLGVAAVFVVGLVRRRRLG